MKKGTSVKRRIVAGILSITMLMYGMRICACQQMGVTNISKAAEICEDITEKDEISQEQKKNVKPVALKHVKKNVIEKNKKLKSTKKEKNYLVITQTEKACKAVEKEYEQAESIGTTSEQHLQDEKITVVRMSGEEACSLQNSPDVLRVEEDVPVQASGHIKKRKIVKKKQDSKEAEWNMQVIKAKKQKKSKEGSEKVKVAVIDSGVDVVNDLIVRENINLIPGEEELLPLFSDITGHGTSVAGIIAAEDNETGITGINPNVEIYAARVLDNDNSAPISRVVEGIYWAIDHDVHIINMSFGTSVDSEILRKAVQDAYEAGILLIASAGNTGDEVEYPAAYPEVVAVGSIDSKGAVCKDSATGSEVELLAPGDRVKSSAGFGTTLICSGTSMAAPHVAGVASLLWEKDLSVSSEFIRKLLAASANHYNENPEYGYGLIDAEYALSLYDEFKADYQNVLMEDIPQVEVNEAVEENASSVVVYDENEYVEGRWNARDHEGVASNLKFMKLGAVYPDKSEYTWKVSKHGAFHGRGKQFEDNIKNVGDYIANTIYLSKIARQGIVRYQDAGMLLDFYDSVDFDEFNVIYNQLKKCEANPDNVDGRYFYGSKSEFLWGFVLHCATDIYAHNAFIRLRNRWYRVIHPANGGVGCGTIDVDNKEITGADDYQFSLGRWLCAQHVAQNLVDRYLGVNNQSEITYMDFRVDDYEIAEQMENTVERPYANLPFKIYKLYTYASRTQWGTIDERGMLLEKTMHFWK